MTYAGGAEESTILGPSSQSADPSQLRSRPERENMWSSGLTRLWPKSSLPSGRRTQEASGRNCRFYHPARLLRRADREHLRSLGRNDPLYILL